MTDANSIIKVLPPSVVEKIAAGEVVERPASVLKELVENSIDAGATRIDITVEDAGFSLMKVSDNGCGMSRADLEMCVLPHATSKIKSADDLCSIATMGFRGEALASISAVSRTSIATTDDGIGGLGYEIVVNGGVRDEEIRPAPRTRGTTITVRDIFYNVPARKKFMKTPRGEQIAIAKMLEQLAVPFPGIHFTVTVDGKKTMELPVVRDLRERICSVAGNDFARGLIECRGENEGEGMSALVYVTSPERLQSKPRFQSLYVNLRRIDNDSVTFAVREAFSKFLGHGNKPAFFCFLDLSPDRTDVNVHPTKQQVKFDDERTIFGFINHTVKDGLKNAGVGLGDLTEGNRATVCEGADGNNIRPSVYALGGDNIMPLKYDMRAGDNNNIRIERHNTYAGTGADGGASRPYMYGEGDPATSQMVLPFPSSPINDSVSPDNILPAGSMIGDIKEAGGGQPWELIQCYQIHGMFILAPIKNGILLIDQHAAHERVLYEQAIADFESSRPISQQLLFPVVIEMGPAEKAVIESGGKYFGDLGFEVSDFGGNSVSISALPAFIKDSRAEETVRGMVRYLLDGRDPDAFREPHKRFAAAFACGAAIKSGQKLSQEEMNSLINQLFSANNPYTCPHGRPTIVRRSVDEIARWFLRT